MFDAHDDACEPRCKPRLDRVRKSGLTADELFDICRGRQNSDDADRLSELDDDWIQAGMLLGLIGSAVVFGVHRPSFHHQLKVIDALDEVHTVDLLPRPNTSMGYQGALGDSIRVNRRACEILGWEEDRKLRCFGHSNPPFLFDIDLDYFAIPWEQYILPWTEEIFRHEFLTPSRQHTTQGLTARDFMDGLLDRAALLTIATEPRHCGDGELEGPKVASILNGLNNFAFEGRMDIENLRKGEVGSR
ncbi:hypothetical protein [Paludibaculum fermentans]|uniref:hypothetical protein n=1 Tax=Paludibaculum fermentans TaxID=1473598 RepID=UPI003EBF1A73